MLSYHHLVANWLHMPNSRRRIRIVGTKTHCFGALSITYLVLLLLLLIHYLATGTL